MVSLANVCACCRFEVSSHEDRHEDDELSTSWVTGRKAKEGQTKPLWSFFFFLKVRLKH